MFDYTRWRGVEHTEIVLPTPAARFDIAWARNRVVVECAGDRREAKGCRVAREYEVALPYELNRDQRTALVRLYPPPLGALGGAAVNRNHSTENNLSEREGDQSETSLYSLTRF